MFLCATTKIHKIWSGTLQQRNSQRLYHFISSSSLRCSFFCFCYLLARICENDLLLFLLQYFCLNELSDFDMKNKTYLFIVLFIKVNLMVCLIRATKYFIGKIENNWNDFCLLFCFKTENCFLMTGKCTNANKWHINWTFAYICK